MTKVKKGKIGPEEIKRRAEQLLTVLELVYSNPDKTTTYGELVKLMSDMPRAIALMKELFKTSILTKGKGRLKPETAVKYTGIEPVYIVAKKIVVSVIEEGRSWNEKQRKEGSRSPHRAAVEAAVIDTSVDNKAIPLQYNNFLKELQTLKQRYKLTVPNAHIEITVKVSSTITV